MPDRMPVIGGNWKMNGTRAAVSALARAIAADAPRDGTVETIVFPAFPHLALVAADLDGSAVALGGQDLWYEADGAFTGEVSAAMLRDCGASWVLCGHSERRHVIGEDETLVNRKVRAALDAGLRVVLCVGETLEQREAGRTDEVNLGQLNAGLAGISAVELERMVLAYEPVWAIGTGRTASPEDAATAHRAIRAAIAEAYDPAVAEAIRIQYGGSVKPGNAAELFADPDVDGFLVGGASLEAKSFLAIVEAAHAAAARS